jgi:hypothetical protein
VNQRGGSSAAFKVWFLNADHWQCGGLIGIIAIEHAKRLAIGWLLLLL